MFIFLDLAKLREKLREQSQSASKSDHVVRELQNREQDLMESLAAKDTQLGVLRVRLEEADRDLQIRQKSLESLQSERERYLISENYVFVDFKIQMLP